MHSLLLRATQSYNVSYFLLSDCRYVWEHDVGQDSCIDCTRHDCYRKRGTLNVVVIIYESISIYSWTDYSPKSDVFSWLIWCQYIPTLVSDGPMTTVARRGRGRRDNDGWEKALTHQLLSSGRDVVEAEARTAISVLLHLPCFNAVKCVWLHRQMEFSFWIFAEH